MPGLFLKQFSGEVPRCSATLLGATQAQKAHNCNLDSGALRAWKDNQFVVTPSKSGTKLTIYRFGQDVTDETKYWFHWTTDVDCVRGPIAGDVTERTYFTGDGVPKVTNNDIALAGGTSYPMAAYTLGLPAPATPPSVSASGTAQTGAMTESRAYVYTYVSGWGEESAPSYAGTVDVQTGQTAVLNTLATVPSGAYNVATKRIYRSVTSSNGATPYVFVDEIPVGQTNYTDSKTAEQIGPDQLPSLNWDMPPSDLHALTAGTNGVIGGLSGNNVCFCDPFHPHAWPLDYQLAMSYKGVGLGFFSDTFVALTNGKPYLISGTDPSSMSMQELDIEQACVSKRSIVSVHGGVIYAAPDGLVMVGLGGVDIITKNHFTRIEWQLLNPSSIHAYQFDGKYYGFYDTGTVQGGFIFDPVAGTLTYLDFYATAGYTDPIRGQLYLQVGNDIVRFNGSATALTYTWRSKIFPVPQPMNMAAALVDAESYPVTFKLYTDGQLKYTYSVPSNEPFPLPSGYLAKFFEMELSGSTAVRAVYVDTDARHLKEV